MEGTFTVTVKMDDQFGNTALEATGRGHTAEDAFKKALSNIASALSKSESEG